MTLVEVPIRIKDDVVTTAHDFLFGDAEHNEKVFLEQTPSEPEAEPLDLNGAVLELLRPLDNGRSCYSTLKPLSFDKLKKLKKSFMVVRQRFGSRDLVSIDKILPEELYNIGILLFGLNNLDINTRVKWETDLKAKEILKSIAEPETNFPLGFRNVAKTIFDLRESQNWTKPPVEKKPRPAKNPRQERNMSTDPGRISPSLALAPPDHPIFGLNGIMHHILWSHGKHIHAIDPHYLRIKRSYKVYGENGLTVGDCWPTRTVALRDGAHGATVGGISGDENGGAYSIVISKYGDVDKDSGEHVFYSAPLGNETDNPEVGAKSNGEKVLLRSIDTKNPVRVLRTHKSEWPGSPKKGIRYDGLYHVYEAARKTNRKGGVYTYFKLRRIPGQDPIDISKPTIEQILEFEKIQFGY